MARYWVGGTGTWNTTNTTNWSATTGPGGGGASVPTSADDVFFDANSGSGTCTVGASVTVKSINFSNTSVVVDSMTSNYPIIASGGNITLGSTSNLSQAWLRLAPTTAISTTISGASTLFKIDLLASNAGATASLGSNVSCSSTFTIYTSSGFGAAGSNSLANFNLTCAAFTITTGALSTVDLGSGTINTSATVSFPSDGTTVTSSNVNLNLTQSGTQSVFLYSRTVASISSSSSTSINLRTAGTAGALTYAPTSGTRALTLFSNFTVTGLLTVTNAGGTLTCKSDFSGTQRTFSAGSVSLTGVSFQDINAAGASIPWTGTGLINLGNNANISFSSTGNGLFFGSNF